ncbi:DEAD/DEAH box helicase family protein [Nonomuraea recticatena]|uniref:Superfamily II DNA or RNA helicase n=1 Tax=Nonomuraea recticatena TaxID=46178 RepID=A0ABP6DZB8_9ACTN
MTQRIVTDRLLDDTGWQAFERVVERLLLGLGYESIQRVGASGDGGADVIGTLHGRRWLFQAKRWAQPVGAAVVAETIAACHRYEADIPVLVSLNGFEPVVRAQQQELATQGLLLQLWDRKTLRRQAERIPEAAAAKRFPERYELRSYQAQAVDRITAEFVNSSRSALVSLATGLGKTVVAAEFHRRFSALRPGARTLVLAHRNELVYQLERAFWPMLPSSMSTGVWNGHERPNPATLGELDIVFACVDSVATAVKAGRELPPFNLVVVDECHHLGTRAYDAVLGELSAGDGGAFLVGMTATPWRPDGTDLRRWFDYPVADVDLVRGLREGYLSNVDYRMYTDNIDWEALARGLSVELPALSPRGINRTLFIDEWDDAVVERLAQVWREQKNPRGIVFCGTIDHAERMAGRINALGFTAAAVIASRRSDGKAMDMPTRSRALWDFADGRTGIVCAVDILNEGVDVPDVNIVVFQRVTHSRRIFVQQLGRGLRLSPGKDRVIVLDFVSDIRRFAAGLDLQEKLGNADANSPRIRLGSKVTFLRAGREDVQGAQFLREWLGDVEAIQDAGEDAHILRYPPNLPSR